MPAAGSAHANTGLRWGNMQQQTRIASIDVLSIGTAMDCFSGICFRDRELTGTRFRVSRIDKSQKHT